MSAGATLTDNAYEERRSRKQTNKHPPSASTPMAENQNERERGNVGAAAAGGKSFSSATGADAATSEVWSTQGHCHSPPDRDQAKRPPP